MSDKVFKYLPRLIECAVFRVNIYLNFAAGIGGKAVTFKLYRLHNIVFVADIIAEVGNKSVSYIVINRKADDGNNND